MRKVVVGLSALVIAGTIAWAANNVPFATFGGTRTVFKTTDTAGVHVPHVNVDSGGGGGPVTVVDGGDVTQGTTTDAACATDNGTCTVIALLKRIAQRITTTLTNTFTVKIDQTTPGTTNGVQVNAALPAGTNTIGTAGSLPYPVGATPYTATATGTTGATTATLAGASSVTTYLCGFSIRANATAAVTGNATVTGVITATLNFTQWTAPNASGLGVTEMIFAPCIPASATNTSIAVVSAAPGTGGVVSVTAWGYKL